MFFFFVFFLFFVLFLWRQVDIDHLLVNGQVEKWNISIMMALIKVNGYTSKRGHSEQNILPLRPHHHHLETTLRESDLGLIDLVNILSF